MSDSNQFFTNHSSFSIEELITIFRQSSEKIFSLHTYSSSDFKVLNVHIRRYYQQAKIIAENISQPGSNLTNQEQNLSQQAAQSLQEISSIVTKLQYHDIIRQKLEHIQQTNEYIIGELLAIPKQHVRSHARETFKYLSIIPDIAKLHVAQLTHTNLEYQSAFENIKTNLKTIKSNTANIAEFYTQFSGPAEKPDIAECSQKPREITVLASKLSAEISTSLAEIKHCDSFGNLVEEINTHLVPLFPDSNLNTIHTPSQENPTITQLKHLYTMESERMIHNQVLGKDYFSEADTPKTDKDDNLELF